MRIGYIAYMETKENTMKITIHFRAGQFPQGMVTRVLTGDECKTLKVKEKSMSYTTDKTMAQVAMAFEVGGFDVTKFISMAFDF